MKPSPTRSKLEARVMSELESKGSQFEYEGSHLGYVIPESNRRYLWDFKFPNDVIIEVKGKLDQDTRRKMLLVKKYNPEADIRFVFHRNNLLVKRGKRRYSDWARINKFPYCFISPGKKVKQAKPWQEILEDWYNE